MIDTCTCWYVEPGKLVMQLSFCGQCLRISTIAIVSDKVEVCNRNCSPIVAAMK